MLSAPPCPRCQEDRLTEVVITKGKRNAYCAVCAHVWPYEVGICHCGVVPVPHLEHDYERPSCPRCGGFARMTKPV